MAMMMMMMMMMNGALRVLHHGHAAGTGIQYQRG